MVLKSITALAVAGLMSATAWAADIPADMPTEPRDGKPPAGATQSVGDLESQVTYQRAFEAVIWSMPVCTENLNPNVVVMKSAKDHV